MDVLYDTRFRVRAWPRCDARRRLRRMYDGEQGLLWSVEEPIVTVRSLQEPAHPDPDGDATATSTSRVRLEWDPGSRLRWTIAAVNPMRKPSGGTRQPVTERSAFASWLETRLCGVAFDTCDSCLERREHRRCRRANVTPLKTYFMGGVPTVMWSATGIATVTDAQAWSTVLHDGVGRAKSLGCGLVRAQET